MTEPLVDVFIKSITLEADRINSFELRASNGEPLPPFTAGAHTDLHLEAGLVRSYSLTNSPAERPLLHCGQARAGRPRGSSYVHGTKVGHELKVSEPRNHFVFDEGDHRSVFIAGGIGVTPILSMIRRASALSRPWTACQAARTRRDAAFLTEIGILARTARGALNVVFDHEADGATLDIDAIAAEAAHDTHPSTHAAVQRATMLPCRKTISTKRHRASGVAGHQPAVDGNRSPGQE